MPKKVSELQYVEKKLEKTLIIFLIVYFLLWIIIPVFLSSSYPLDVPEGIYWGKEWQLGYYKHSPFSSWVLYSFYLIFGQIGPYFLSQICIALTILFVYLLGRNLVSQEKAFYSAIFVLSIFDYTWPSLEFNHDIAQMPIWAGLIYIFYLILKKNTWSLWILFGIVIGIGMLTKYSVALLVFAQVLFSILTEYRKCWLSAKPWVSILIAFAVFSPHVLWLYQHNWLPFTYIQSRSHQGSVNHFAAFKYLAAQVANFLPLILILLCNKSFFGVLGNIKKNDRNFLIFMGVLPGMLLFFIGLILGVSIKDMWASPMWSLVALILIAMIPDYYFQEHKKGLAKGLMIWLILITFFMACYMQVGGEVRNKPSRMDWPQQELGLKTQQQWHESSRCELDNIGGDNWLAILAATSMDKMPSVMMNTLASYSPWMSLRRLEHSGSFMLWEKGKKPLLPYEDELEKNQQFIVQRGEWLIKWNKIPNKVPLTVEWQIFIPKHCAKS